MSVITSTNQGIKSYPRRWLVLFIAGSGIFVRAFSQSCFGNINDVYVKYFDKAAWQIDWLVVIQSVSVMLAMLPMTIGAKKMNVRATLCFTTALSFFGYVLNAVGYLTRKGYSVVLVGQAMEGISSIVSWSLMPLVAAVWFPSHQVAIAVAAQIISRGIGETAGSIIPPYIVSVTSTSVQVKWRIFAMFVSLAAISSLMFVMSVLFTSGPPTPPSEAEGKALNLRIREQSAHFSELMKNNAASIKSLFTSTTFLFVWITSGAISPVLRTNNTLLSSMLHKTFPEAKNINKNVGVFIGVAWLLSTLGSFVAGPIIAKTHRYKEITLAGLFVLFLSAIMLLIGMQYQTFHIVCIAVLIQGFSIGVLFTSLLELLVEVTYPESTMFVSMVTIAIVSLFRLFYSIIERVLLEKVNATAANLLPVVVIFVCFVLILFMKKDYRRLFANNEQELEILIKSSRNSEMESNEE